MKIIVEEYPYTPTDEVRSVLRGLVEDLENVEGRLRVNYVGYYYNPTLRDTVFCLPKVVLQEGKDDKTEKVFGLYRPEDLLKKDYWEKEVEEQYKDFLFGLSVWIYRAVNVYRQQFPESSIVLHRQVQIAGHGKKSIPDTYLDILLALIQFNRDNSDFLLFTIKNIHSGCNKINWTKTISHSSAFIQDGTPIYLDMVNKRKQINFDEELLVIYYSILEYLHRHYGFRIRVKYNFNTLSEGQFAQYMDGLGRTRLKQIKYKYFSDKAIELWQLCYAFFDHNYELAIASDQRQYMLVKNFNIVFEAIIDKLIGTPIDELPTKLKEQKDGKVVDHLYTDTALSSLIHASEEQKQVYYIGDSKYYKMHHGVGENSEYKQYTYAKNIIHYNLDLFLRSQRGESFVEGRDFLIYRDDTTEGYEITPNFFISADIDGDLSYNEQLKPMGEPKMTCQFENRLFDRDTLLLSHYDVNFLHVLSLYARDNATEQETWKASVRKKFREQIQGTLNSKFDFYAMTAHADVDPEQYIRENFQMLLGKVYTPFNDKEYYSLALDMDNAYAEENEMVLSLLKQNFYLGKCPLGIDPATVIKKVPRLVRPTIPQRYLTMHWLENYQDANILVGCYKDQAHLDWILGNNDKGTLIYNVRLDKKRAGSMVRARILENKAKFVILFPFNEDYKNEYRVFRVHHTAQMTEKRMAEAWYPNPQGKYFCYVFDEEISFGNLDIRKLIATKRIESTFIEGAPFFISSEELLKYRV